MDVLRYHVGEAFDRALEKRGLEVSDEARAQVLACQDLARLDAWLARALTATSPSATLPAVTDRRRATYQDVLDAPPNMVAEVIDGQLVLMPRPAKPHALAASALGQELGPPFQRGKGGPGGWFVLDEPELHLGADILVPDLAGWRRETLEVMRRQGSRWLLVGVWSDEARVRAEPFDAIELELGALWAGVARQAESSTPP